MPPVSYYCAGCSDFHEREIAAGPQKLVTNQGVGFLVTEQDGQIDWPTDKASTIPTRG